MLALGEVAEGAESLLEVAYVRKVERAHGLPRATRQVRSAGVRRDFEYEEWGVVVEVDGRLGHEGEHLAIDRRRDRRAAGQGKVTLRAGWVDVEADSCELAVDVHGALWVRGYREPLRPCGVSCPIARRRLSA